MGGDTFGPSALARLAGPASHLVAGHGCAVHQAPAGFLSSVGGEGGGNTVGTIKVHLAFLGGNLPWLLMRCVGAHHNLFLSHPMNLIHFGNVPVLAMKRRKTAIDTVFTPSEG